MRDDLKILAAAMAYLESPPIYAHKPWASKRGRVRKVRKEKEGV